MTASPNQGSEPSKKENVSTPPPGEPQVPCAKILPAAVVGQSKVRFPRPEKVRLSEVMSSGGRVKLKRTAHPYVPDAGRLGTPANWHVDAFNEISIGSEAFKMTHTEGFEIQTFGSRTWTWKSTALARAWLENPRTRARTNMTRRRCFISIFLRRRELARRS